MAGSNSIAHPQRSNDVTRFAWGVAKDAVIGAAIVAFLPEELALAAAAYGVWTIGRHVMKKRWSEAAASTVGLISQSCGAKPVTSFIIEKGAHALLLGAKSLPPVPPTKGVQRQRRWAFNRSP